MNLALVLGQQGEKVKPKLRNIKDNLRIDCYMNIPHFIDSSIKRDLRYDRVVVLSKLTTDVGIKDLAKYWRKYCKETEIIFLCKANVDEDLAKRVLKEFVSNKVAAMLVETTTLGTFSECVLLDTEKITEKYGIEKYLSVEVDDEGGPVFNIPTENKKVDQDTPKVNVQQTTEKPKKKGFFGRLFGGKQKPVEDELHTEETDDQTQDTIDEKVENTESELEGQIQENEVSTEEEADFTDTESSESSPEVPDEPTDNSKDQENSDDEETENQDVNTDTASATHSNKVKEEINEFDFGAVDVDFGDVTFDASSVAPAMAGTMVGVADEVDDEEEVLSGYENQYRYSYNQQRSPQDFKKLASSGHTALANIYGGKSHKVIIVTGDRGSGVTVTAYSIAKEFAKKVPVLYFDCDIDRHGLLSYIDYEFFRTFDTSMIEGIKRCRDSSIFANCTVNYDINLNLLTSDYSCDADDESIRMAHNVVSENVMNYGVVVIDCPVNKLHLIQDLIFIGNTIVCMESSKRGVMNMLCGLEGSPLELRYKRCICSKGMILATKLNKRIKTDSVLHYADTIFASNGCDWLHMDHRDFTGNLTTDLLNEIVEG